MAKPRIWMECKVNPNALARLQEVAEVLDTGDLSLLPGCEAAIITSLPPADGAFMDKAGPSLKVIARPGIGVDNVDIPAATQRGILVVNTPDAPTESTAEHAVALMMALAKWVVRGDMQMRGAAIPRGDLLGTEMRGRVLGIIGFGRIGKRVSEICGLGLKMRVIAYDPYVDTAEFEKRGVQRFTNLDALLAESDFVTLHPSVTHETRGMFDETRLRKIKRGAYLINAGRGALLSEAALYKVLQEGHLAGAALDVYEPEPTSPDNPLLKLPNVVVSPHVASFTDQGLALMGDGTADQVLQVLRGERPANLLDPSVWPGRVGK